MNRVGDPSQDFFIDIDGFDKPNEEKKEEEKEEEKEEIANSENRIEEHMPGTQLDLRIPSQEIQDGENLEKNT